jgi:probable addiction module antidote protein
MPKLRSYDKYLIESLKDSNEAYLYLAAAFEDDDPRIAAIALDYVLKARNYSVKQISEQAHLNREHLYRVFSGRSKPEFTTIKALCHLAGFNLTVQDSGMHAS